MYSGPAPLWRSLPPRLDRALLRTGPPAPARLALRRLGAAAAALAAALLSVVVTAAPASAHATLLRISPADGSVLHTVPSTVTLTFDEAVSPTFSNLLVFDPTGSNVATGPAVVHGTTVSVGLPTSVPSGIYRIAYRVVSDDGHPVSGSATFTLALPAAATASPLPATPATTPGRSPEAASPTSPGASTSWLADNLGAVAAGLVLVVIGVGALLWDRRRH